MCEHLEVLLTDFGHGYGHVFGQTHNGHHHHHPHRQSRLGRWWKGALAVAGFVGGVVGVRNLPPYAISLSLIGGLWAASLAAILRNQD